MRIRKKNIDRVHIERTNNQHKQHVDSLRSKLEQFDSNKITKDSDLCNYCSFIVPERIGGSSITNVECGICGKEMVFGNTNVDAICSDCAKTNQLCKHCAGDIEMKNRRKPRAYEEKVKLFS